MTSSSSTRPWNLNGSTYVTDSFGGWASGEPNSHNVGSYVARMINNELADHSSTNNYGYICEDIVKIST